MRSSSDFLRLWNIRLVFLVVLVALNGPTSASDRYQVTNRLDSVALLAPPPVPGAPDYKADLNCARAVFKGRTREEEAKATKLAKLTIFNFTPAIGEFFQPGKFPKLEAFFDGIKPEIKPSIDAAKEHWKRTRPYDVDKELWLGQPEQSYSYPSGHSTVGMIQALVLAEIFPEKRDAIVQIARDIGWARVVIGKHFPTDVHAGRVLAQAVVRELLASEEFQKDIAGVSAEVQAYLQASKN
jgi:acid phosphatase (class A)